MIKGFKVQDRRFPLQIGAGSDAIHKDPVYSYAVTVLLDDKGRESTGLAFTIGAGNELVCQAIQFYAEKLVGKDIEEIMANFGQVFKSLGDEPQFRWLGPHKGVVHLALASVTNACFDLWAKTRGVPLWKLLIDLSPEEIINTVDLSYLEDEMTVVEAVALLAEQQQYKLDRMPIVGQGYPGYDTSVGWFNYSDQQVEENCQKALDAGFKAMKLKVGNIDPLCDIRRAHIVRNTCGDNAKVMLDANQQWSVSQALSIGQQLKEMNPYWIEEPTHPDDIMGHSTLAQSLTPIRIATGEHVPNRIVFKNYLQMRATSFVQVDAVRVGGVSEFIAISLLAKKYNIPVVPHVGDMGQLHQHLVLFNHISMGHEALFLEHIPHLKSYFKHPVCVADGVYHTPMEEGSSCDLL